MTIFLYVGGLYVYVLSVYVSMSVYVSDYVYPYLTTFVSFSLFVACFSALSLSHFLSFNSLLFRTANAYTQEYKEDPDKKQGPYSQNFIFFVTYEWAQ